MKNGWNMNQINEKVIKHEWGNRNSINNVTYNNDLFYFDTAYKLRRNNDEYYS